MNYLFLLLGFFSFTSIAFSIEKHLPDYLKHYSFIAAISSIAIVIYTLTFKVNFYYIQYALYLFAICLLASEYFKNKSKNIKLFFSSHRLVFLLSFVWFILTINVQILQWDDFSWGSFVKHLNHYGTYWTSDAAILQQGLRYFPGLSLWENFFIGKDQYFEQPLFFALGLICITCFYALRPPKSTSKQTAYLFLFFSATISWFTSGLGTISTEASMGFLLGVGIISSFDVKKSSDLFVPFIITVFLAITKETALILSLLIILLIIIKVLREKTIFSKWTIFSVLCLLWVFFNYQLWQWHLKKDPAMVPFNSSEILKNIFNDLHHLSDRSRETLVLFFKALYNRPITRSYLSRIPLPGLSLIKGFYIFWTLILAIIFFQIRKNFEYLITFFWGLIGYTLVLVVTFLYFFGEYEGRNLASYERYIGVYFLAFSLIAIKVFTEKKLWKKKFFLKLAMALILIFPPSPKILYPPSIIGLVPDPIMRKLHMKTDNTRNDVQLIRTKIITLTPTNSKVWFIWQNSNGQQAMVVRYEIAPRKMNTVNWSVGDKYYPGDVWTSGFNLKGLATAFEGIDYVALGFVDHQFVQKFGTLFTTSPKSGALYKKEMINSQLRLVEI